MRIQRLQCNIKVRTGKAPAKPGAQDKPSSPRLQLAVLPVAEPHAVVDSVPVDTNVGKPGDRNTEIRTAEAIAHVDARAVADRVYNLMREEFLQTRRRGLGDRRG